MIFDGRWKHLQPIFPSSSRYRLLFLLFGFFEHSCAHECPLFYVRHLFSYDNFFFECFYAPCAKVATLLCLFLSVRLTPDLHMKSGQIILVTSSTYSWDFYYNVRYCCIAFSPSLSFSNGCSTSIGSRFNYVFSRTELCP